MTEWPPIGKEENMMSAQCKDFIIKLLDKNYQTRLGANGSDEIKKHPWFKGN